MCIHGYPDSRRASLAGLWIWGDGIQRYDFPNIVFECTRLDNQDLYTFVLCILKIKVITESLRMKRMWVGVVAYACRGSANRTAISLYLPHSGFQDIRCMQTLSGVQ